MADLGFDGKVAIITGAGGGLGRSHALDLAKRGALIVVNDLGGSTDGVGSSEAAAQKVVDEIKAAGGEAVANYDSVATPEGGANIVQDRRRHLRPGRHHHQQRRHPARHLVQEHDPRPGEPRARRAPPRRLLRDPAGVAAHARPGLRPHRQHALGAGIFGNFGQANYGAAKMGLVGLTRVLAVEGAKNNIKVNAIAPVAKTRMTEELFGEAMDKLAPEIVTPIVTYLAHEDCAVSGEVYSVGGGRVARIFVGVTPGYFDADLTAESVRDNLEKIRKEDGYEVPANLNEEMMLAFKSMG